VAGSYEYGDEPTGSGATELVGQNLLVFFVSYKECVSAYLPTWNSFSLYLLYVMRSCRLTGRHQTFGEI
jgi:hypothetical protein